MNDPSQLFEFKFRFYKGNIRQSMGSKPGYADSTGLNLDGSTLPYGQILNTAFQDNFYSMLLSSDAQSDPKLKKYADKDNVIVIGVAGGQGENLVKFVSRTGSASDAQEHRKALEKEGKGHLFRMETCPECSGTVDLSELDKSPYLYCPHCATLFDSARNKVEDPAEHNACPECGMFSHLKTYTEFYFYFLLVFYGWRYNKMQLCANCAGGKFIKNLLLNLLFLLGIPAAIWMKLKTLIGRDPKYPALSKANKLALKGRHMEADAIYTQLLAQYPNHPGILHNRAVAYLIAGDGDSGSAYIDQVLNSCCNYGPTFDFIRELQALEEQG